MIKSIILVSFYSPFGSRKHFKIIVVFSIQGWILVQILYHQGRK